MHAVELEADYQAFKRRHGGFMDKGHELADPDRKLLVLSFSSYVAQIKAEALLAEVLQLKGLTPVVITHSSAHRALRYFQVFGIDRFVFFDTLPKGNISKRAIGEAEAFFVQPLTVQSVKDFEYRGTKLGSRILRTFTRTNYQGSVDLLDPGVIGELKSLMLQGMDNVEKAEILLDTLQPEIILTHHPLNLGEGDIYDAGLQRGINTIYWDEAQKSDHWLFGRYTKETRGRQLFSLSDETWDEAQRLIWDDDRDATLMEEIKKRYTDLTADNRRLQEGKRIKTVREVQHQLGLDPRKKTAVIFSHIVWDTSFLHGVDLFDTYEEWLVETTRAACDNSALNWIIKLHPANLMKLRGNQVGGEPSEVVAINAAIGNFPEHVKLLHSDTDINTYSLFDLTDYCLTVRGTIGIEMPCYGIPVFTAGTGRYSGRGFTEDSNSQNEYLGKLTRIQDYPPLSPTQIELAKKHAYWLLLKRPLRLDVVHKTMRQDLVKNADHPLATNFVFTITSLDDLESNPGLVTFTNWALDSRQPEPYSDQSRF